MAEFLSPAGAAEFCIFVFAYQPSALTWEPATNRGTLHVSPPNQSTVSLPGNAMPISKSLQAIIDRLTKPQTIRQRTNARPDHDYNVLEPRHLLATITWDGGGDGTTWEDPLNWVGDALPGSADDAVLGIPANPSITVSSNQTINSLVSDEAFMISGGTFDVATTVQVNNTFQIAGGTLKDATVLAGTSGEGLSVTSADGTLDGVTLSADTTLLNGAQVTALNGLTLDNNTLRLQRTTGGGSAGLDLNDVGLTFLGGAQTLGGTGILELHNANTVSSTVTDLDVRVAPGGGGSLTIGAGIDVRNTTDSKLVSLGIASLGLTLEGTVTAQSAGETLRINGSTVTNNGTLEVDAGTLDVNGLSGNLGTTMITAGNLDLDGSYTINSGLTVPSGGSLNLRGSWNNTSTITQNGGTIDLDGTFTVGNLGANIATNFPGTAGTVRIVGELNDAATLLTDSDRTWQLHGGQITNATVGGDGILRVTSSDGTLDGVTLSADTTLLNGAQVTALNGLTLDNNTLRLQRTTGGGSAGLDLNDVGLTFSGGAQTLGGTGILELHNANTVSSTVTDLDVRVAPGGGGSLTIGAGIDVRNTTDSKLVSLGIASLGLTLEGTVTAQSAGETLRINGSTVTNNGTLEVDAGTLDVNGLSGNLGTTMITAGNLDLDGSYTINSGLTVPSGGNLNLRGSWNNTSTITQNGGTIDLDGTFTVGNLGANIATNFPGTAGTVRIVGELNDAATLLTDSDRTWQLHGGQITNATVGGDGILRVTSSDGTLDGVTLSADTTLLNGAQVTALNGLTLDNNTLRLQRTTGGGRRRFGPERCWPDIFWWSTDVGWNRNSGAPQRQYGLQYRH